MIPPNIFMALVAIAHAKLALSLFCQLSLLRRRLLKPLCGKALSKQNTHNTTIGVQEW